MLTEQRYFKQLDRYPMVDLIEATKVCRYDLLICMRSNAECNVWKEEIEDYLYNRDDFEYED